MTPFLRQHCLKYIVTSNGSLIITVNQYSIFASRLSVLKNLSTSSVQASTFVSTVKLTSFIKLNVNVGFAKLKLECEIDDMVYILLLREWSLTIGGGGSVLFQRLEPKNFSPSPVNSPKISAPFKM